MIAEKNETFREASENLYNLNLDDIARQKAKAREHYNRLEDKVESLTEEVNSLTEEVVSLKKILDEHGIPYKKD